MENIHIKSFYDSDTGTFTHVIVDKNTKKCAVVDSVLDYEPNAARVTTKSADKVISYIRDNDLENEWLLETHIHADHITAAFYLKEHIGGKTAIGTGIVKVLETWVPLFDTSADTPLTGEQFDELFEDGQEFDIGSLKAKVIHTPGHTPACSTYIVGNALFVGDTVFAPNLGAARADFPGGNARDLYNSIKRIYKYPDDNIIYLCHDYPKDGDKPISNITIGEQKSSNVMINGETDIDEFVKKREDRDKTLAVPRLLLPSIQTNMRLGDFGVKSANGIQYIKVPINTV